MIFRNSSARIMYIHHLLSEAKRVSLLHFKQELAPLGITPVQYSIMHCIASAGLCTPKAIASELGIDCSTISINLNKMEKNGLIVRRIDPSNRRHVQIETTDTFQNVNRVIENAAVQADDRLMSCFNEAEVDRLCDLLAAFVTFCPDCLPAP